ncbi:uncharacterized protein LY89DRAFT_740009 [Mollisia scopiformis]|uniref:Uncharacterized protein n=1 Tax=Mollisia scopiformis TaxID=149040 RepID=A0A132BCX3_MOLSC|nr:uncharacterized protein LY89DRAFT_740009 [Mollisia scopiformis]KUJ10275.1 hypothetical protein LY89DRAFT_740009 [Mollisia scopiformis]
MLLKILEILQLKNERFGGKAKDSIAYNFMDDKESGFNDAKQVYETQQDKESTHWDHMNEYARSILRLKALLDSEEQQPVPINTRDVDLYSLSNYNQAERIASQFNLVGNAGRWVEPTPPASPLSEGQAEHTQYVADISSSAVDKAGMTCGEHTNPHASTTVWSGY